MQVPAEGCAALARSALIQHACEPLSLVVKSAQHKPASSRTSRSLGLQIPAMSMVQAAASKAESTSSWQHLAAWGLELHQACEGYEPNQELASQQSCAALLPMTNTLSPQLH